jgi:hypothetical protein
MQKKCSYPPQFSFCLNAYSERFKSTYNWVILPQKLLPRMGITMLALHLIRCSKAEEENLLMNLVKKLNGLQIDLDLGNSGGVRRRFYMVLLFTLALEASIGLSLGFLVGFLV